MACQQPTDLGEVEMRGQERGGDDQKADTVMAIMLLSQFVEEALVAKETEGAKSGLKQGREVVERVEGVLMRCLEGGLF